MLTVSADKIAEAESASGATVAFDAPTATDAGSGVQSVSCNRVSGSVFPFGPTTVGCTATDNAGNAASGSFIVTVSDTTKPIVTAPGNMIVEATSLSGAVVTFAASATDNIDGPRPVTCVPAPGSTFPVATTTVSCTAGDLHGNQNTATFTVQVIPKNTKPPKVKVPNAMKVQATGPSGAVVTFIATATDQVDGPVPVVCAPPSGSVFPLGATTVTCSATNSFGLSDTDSFIVTVR